MTVIIPSRIRDTVLEVSVVFTSNTYLPARRFAVLAASIVSTSSPLAVLEKVQVWQLAAQLHIPGTAE